MCMPDLLAGCWIDPESIVTPHRPLVTLYRCSGSRVIVFDPLRRLSVEPLIVAAPGAHVPIRPANDVLVFPSPVGPALAGGSGEILVAGDGYLVPGYRSVTGQVGIIVDGESACLVG
jgi:hypothetical protein